MRTRNGVRRPSSAGAPTIGPATETLVHSARESSASEQGYRSCLGLIRLGKQYGPVDSQYQDACTSALGFDERFSILVGAEQLSRQPRPHTAAEGGQAPAPARVPRRPRLCRCPQVFRKPHRPRFPTAPTAILSGAAGEERRPPFGRPLSRRRRTQSTTERRASLRLIARPVRAITMMWNGLADYDAWNAHRTAACLGSPNI